MILEADEKMKIGGKEYKVRFTVKSIFNLARYFRWRNIEC